MRRWRAIVSYQIWEDLCRPFHQRTGHYRVRVNGPGVIATLPSLALYHTSVALSCLSNRTMQLRLYLSPGFFRLLYSSTNKEVLNQPWDNRLLISSPLRYRSKKVTFGRRHRADSDDLDWPLLIYLMKYITTFTTTGVCGVGSVGKSSKASRTLLYAPHVYKRECDRAYNDEWFCKRRNQNGYGRPLGGDISCHMYISTQGTQ